MTYQLRSQDYSSPARELGCDLNDDGTVTIDDHGQTSVEDVYAVGDLTPGHNQIPIALGDGATAGISIHFALGDFPREPETIEEAGPVRSRVVPAIPDELLEQVVALHAYEESTRRTGHVGRGDRTAGWKISHPEMHNMWGGE